MSKKFQTCGIKSMSFGKMSTYYQDLLDISANVNNFLDSLQLIPAITLHIPHCTISCKI